MTGLDVVREARTQLGVPWVHQGVLRGVALDCIGLAGVVGATLGFASAIAWLRDPAMHDYGTKPDPVVLMATVPKYLDPIPIASAGVGDILVMRFARYPQHFAIVSSVSPMTIIHAYRSARKVAENNIADRWRHDTRWSDLIVSAWRYKELT